MNEGEILKTLTPEVVKEAYKEARDGTVISLQWNAEAFGHLSFIEEGRDTNATALSSPLSWTS